MIGIICAMKIEAQKLIELMDMPCAQKISGIEFVSGTLNGKSAVIAVCGIGKVFAALCAQTMILRFSPDFIVNTGVGGTLTDKLHCGSIAIGASVVQHDMDTTALGDEPGLVSGINKVYFSCDKSAVQRLMQIAELCKINAVSGVIASGDIFVNDENLKMTIVNRFDAIACDMESGAIGHVCFVNDVPFVAFRAISDEADGSSHMDYNTFIESAAQMACDLLLAFLSI